MTSAWDEHAARHSLALSEPDIKKLYRPPQPACFLAGQGWLHAGGGGWRRFDDLFINRDGRVALVEAKSEIHGNLTADRRNSLYRKLAKGSEKWLTPKDALSLVAPCDEHDGIRGRIDDHLALSGGWATDFRRPDLIVVCSRATGKALATFDSLVEPHLATWLASATLVILSRHRQTGLPYAMPRTPPPAPRA